MKQSFLKSFLWLSAVAGYSGLFTVTPQIVIAETDSPQLFVQQTDKTEETAPSK
ncbi:MAG: hypothetical protein SWJ54_02665 [Cyanobacteriota bacterium]|nr:hypothetical protein [Cyanobacteriota bacterium]